jgi:hypothetical protein
MRFSKKQKRPVSTIVVLTGAINESRTFKTLDLLSKDALIEIMDYYVDTYNPTSVADLSVTVNGVLLPPIPDKL